MNAKHTAGPWTIDTWTYSQRTPPEIVPVVIGNGTMIAELANDSGTENPFTVPLSEAQANARLIVAAPDMLYALKEIVGMIELRKLNVRKDFSLINAHAYATNIIAKAEGVDL